MKTLNEVIKANECCDHGELDSRCEDCPYNGIGACCAERESDALHYLKMYRSDQIEWEAAREDWNEKWETFIVARERHLDAVKELKRNDPLTWDELKTMEGKPVWVEAYDPIDEKTGWRTASWKLIEFINDEYFDVRDSDGEQECYYKSESEYWQAYRKERE